MPEMQLGRFRWVFNIGSLSKFCYRFWTGSVAAYVNGSRDAENFSEVIGGIFPGRDETVLSTNIARAFCCSREHVRELLVDGILKAGTPRPKVRGPYSAWPVMRSELFNWLQSRRIA